MTEVASLYAVLKADVSNLQSGLKTAQTEVARTAQGVRDMGRAVETGGRQANAGAVAASQGIGALGRNILGATASSLGLTLGVAGVTAAVVKFGASSVKAAMDFEQTEIAFTNMLGSGERAMAFLGQLRDFAAKTPFDFVGLTDASRRLMAFGFEAEKIVPMLTNIGDAVAAMGGGAAHIDRVTLALGQMQAKQKVSAQEMLQLTEAGIPAWRYLAESIGVSTGEVMKMSERGLIPAGQAIDAILGGMQRDFGGMMAQQMNTAAGAASNFNDTLTLLKTNLGSLVLPAATGFLQGATERLEAFNQIFEALDKGAISAGRAAALIAELGLAGFDANRELQVLADAMEKYESETAAANARSATASEVLKSLTLRYGELSEAKLGQLDAQGKLTAAEIETILNAQQHGESVDDLIRRLWDGQAALDAWGLRLSGLAEHYSSATAAAYDAGPALGAWTARLQGQADALGVATQANFEWISSTERAAAAQAELTARYADLQTILSGSLGAANREFAESQAAIRDRTLEVLAELTKYNTMHGQTVTMTTDTAEAQRNLTIAMYDAQVAGQRLAEAQAALAENTDPDKQLQLEAAVARAQGAFSGAQGKVEEWNGKLSESGNTYVTDYSGKIDELEGELGELDAAYAANAAAHEAMVQRIVFDMLQQRLAADGWQAGELEMLAGIGQAWGLYDQDTATALANVDAALLASQGNADAFLAYMNRVMGLPDKTVTITTKYVYHGYQPGDPNDPTNYLPPPDVTGPIPMAEGGSGVVTRPTWFLAGEAGPEAFQFMPLGGGGAAGGGVWNGDINLYAGDPREAARAVIEVLQDRGIIAKTLLR